MSPGERTHPTTVAKMDKKINNITSINNILTSAEPYTSPQQQYQQQHQFLHQLLSSLTQQQQHLQQQTQSPTQHPLAIGYNHSPSDRVSNNHTPSSNQQGSRNSSFTSTNGRNKTATVSSKNPTVGNKAPIVNNKNGVVNGYSGKNLVDLITCGLCKGYLIDAITIDLCMHSFCRPCALQYMKDHHRCPECNLEIKDKRFLNRLKTDSTLQSIVYKLVPGLYEKEMARRRTFYAARPTPTPRYKSEMFGDIPPGKTIKPADKINVGLMWSKDSPEDETIKTYLSCPAETRISSIKKLITSKFGLERRVKIYYGTNEILFDLMSLMDIAATFNWSPESKVLELTYKEQDENSTNGHAQAPVINSWTPMHPGLDPSNDP